MNDEKTGEWHRVASTSEVTEDEPKAVQVGDHPVALYKVDGAFYATHDICTHEFASLSEGFIEGDAIECPLHAGKFHIPTGRALAPPVTEDLRTYRVKVEGNDIYVEVPKD
ncbi:MAG: non-heme iron oxygenase ferredoxin subunit [Alphaproteobacteria bacterium]